MQLENFKETDFNYENSIFKSTSKIHKSGNFGLEFT